MAITGDVTAGGVTTGQVFFLGTAVGASVAGDTPTQTATKIAAAWAADTNGIQTNWNNDPSNSNKQIDTITADASGNLTITYKPHMGDVAVIDETTSRGMIYNRTIETTEGRGEDSISYTLDNTHNITVTNGEILLDANGIQVDLNGDSVLDARDNVNSENAINALVYKINNHKDISQTVTAYNGKYELDADGNKILTNNPLHSKYDAGNPNKDRYLYIEADTDGEAGKFVGEIVVHDNANTDTDPLSSTFGKYIGVDIPKDTVLSEEGIDDIHVEIYDQEINLSGGMLKPVIDNIKTNSDNNKFAEFKNMLDQFAKKLSDYSSAFIETSPDTYIDGRDASQIDPNSSKMINIGLFNGADVSSLEFNDSAINTLDQQKLDYLATMQWRENIDFNGTGQDNTSFAKFYQTIRVNVADTRENVIFDQKAQEAVKESIQTTYDKLTKVDKDDELVELIKFQSAYEANAKVITVIDELLSVLLNMKR